MTTKYDHKATLDYEGALIKVAVALHSYKPGPQSDLQEQRRALAQGAINLLSYLDEHPGATKVLGKPWETRRLLELRKALKM